MSGEYSDAGERFQSLDASTKVVNEQGRWVVYLNVPDWDCSPADDQHPVNNQWKRINDYSTQRDAEVAAHWFERSANRTHRPPSGF